MNVFGCLGTINDDDNDDVARLILGCVSWQQRLASTGVFEDTGSGSGSGESFRVIVLE